MTGGGGSPLSRVADLEIDLRRRNDRDYSVELRFTAPDGDAEVRLLREGPGTVTCAALAAVRELELDADRYGAALSSALFGDPLVAGAFAQARSTAASQDAALRVRLHLEPSVPELNDLRWECLRGPDGELLFAGEQIFFSRYLSSLDWRPARLRPQMRMRALAAIANPSNLGEYAPNGQPLAAVDVQAIFDRLKASLPDVELTLLAPAALNGIVDRLREGFDIFYLVCHGALVDGQSRLWLENETGHAAVTSGTAFVDRIRELSQRPRLAILASCQSAGTGRVRQESSLLGLGPRLADAGVPAVLAMQGNLSMETEARFMPVLFRELLRDGQIDRAVALARGAVRERHDYWIPVLFQRLRSGRLWFAPEGGVPGGFQFISYSQQDTPWARWIAWQMEREGFATALQASGFRPGAAAIGSLRKAYAASQRTIVVLSRHLMEALSTEPEWQSAWARLAAPKDRKVVLVRIEECELEGAFAGVDYIDLAGLDEKAARRALLKRIGRPASHTATFTFPPGLAFKQEGPSFPLHAASAISASPNLKVSISCPRQLLGMEPAELEIQFEVEGPGLDVTLAINQKGLLFSGDGQVGPVEFRYALACAGSHRRKIRMFAESDKTQNYAVTVVCANGAGDLLARNSCVIKGLASGPWGRAKSFLRGRAILVGAVALLLCAFSVVLLPAPARYWMVLNASPFRPGNYLEGGKHEWNDFFGSAEVTRASWRLIHSAPVPGGLLLEGSALAFPSKDLDNRTFTDFGAVLKFKIQKGREANWLFRVRNVNESGWVKAYRFKLELVPGPQTPKAPFTIRLTGYKCDNQRWETCRPLVADSAPEIGATDCREPFYFQITARALRNEFTLWPAVLGDPAANDSCGIPQLLGRYRFLDTGFWPHSTFGNVGLIGDVGPGSILLESFQIIEIEKLDPAL
jgi:hypothetical protein